MTKTLKGRKALLIAEGCKLRKEGKVIETRLGEIKKELAFAAPGTYQNEAGDIVQIGRTEKFTEISPKEVLSYLKKRKMTDRFPEIIKIQITALRKIVPESIIEKWRKPLDPIFRWTWK